MYSFANPGKPTWRRRLKRSSVARAAGQRGGVEATGGAAQPRVGGGGLSFSPGRGRHAALGRPPLGGRRPAHGRNFGRLGFLSSFTPDNCYQYLERYLSGDGLKVHRRQMLEASVLPTGAVCRPDDCHDVARHRRFVATALNDAVVTAGPPFHMIELEISEDDEAG